MKGEKHFYLSIVGLDSIDIDNCTRKAETIADMKLADDPIPLDSHNSESILTAISYLSINPTIYYKSIEFTFAKNLIVLMIII